MVFRAGQLNVFSNDGIYYDFQMGFYWIDHLVIHHSYGSHGPFIDDYP
jgi:hypothetical protein